MPDDIDVTDEMVYAAYVAIWELIKPDLPPSDGLLRVAIEAALAARS